MKFPSSILRPRRILFLILLTAFRPAEASPHPSPLPIRASSDIASPRAFETSKSLVVTGHVRSAFRSPFAHADVLLVAPDGTIVAREVDGIAWPHPRTATGRHGNPAFTGRFPLADARKAAGVVIVFSNAPHARCLESSNG